MQHHFIEFKMAKNNNRALVRADQIVYFGECPDGVEVVLEHMEGSLVVKITVDELIQLLTVH